MLMVMTVVAVLSMTQILMMVLLSIMSFQHSLKTSDC